MSQDLHQQIFAFLIGEMAHTEQRQCTKVELLYSQPHCRDQELMTWHRKEDPEAFESVKLMEMVSKIIERAEHETDSYSGGRHRYVVRAHKGLAPSTHMGFSIQSQFQSSSDQSMVVGGGDPGSGAKPDVVTQNNMMLGRLLTNVVQGSYGVLGQTNAHLADENHALRTRCRELEKDLDQARSIRDDRQFEIETKRKKFDREDVAFKKLMQFGSIALAKLGGGGGSGDPTAPNALAMMVTNLLESLQTNQIETIYQALTDPQRAMFGEIAGIAQQTMKQSEAASTASSPNAPSNGTPPS
jgi:hypothetical protein